MPKTILSADSTCDLNAELKAQYDVQYTPLHIMLRGKDYLDNVTITNTDIYNAYWEDGSLPQTGALGPADYREHFKQFTDQGCEVVHFSLGSGLSNSYNAAALAAAELPGVYVVDSGNLSTGIGQLVIRAGRMIAEGKTAAEIAAWAEEFRGHVHSSFILQTMDFLAAGGRCPAIVAYVGRILQFRPEILVNNADGTMKVGKIYRGTMEKALPKYVEDQLEKYGDDIIADDIFITTSEPCEDLKDIAEEVIGRVHPFERMHRTIACCTIGSHCGPRTIGVLFTTKSACK
ncbi:MAG: DegV family EDD domain-containing protein [Eggerthellaceae bacterium]|nr:DegV family EDD domain-containing protein [Eggerthellaceae bacterium]